MTISHLGNIGIGTITPQTKLDVNGSIKISDGTQGTGKILTSNANGVASWQTPETTSWGLAGNAGTVDGTNFIGTTDNIPLTLKVNNQKAGRIDTYNTFYGYLSGNANTTGSGNTAIGSSSLLINTTGYLNTALGYNADVESGNLNNATAIGANAKVLRSNTIQLGDANIQAVYAGASAETFLIAGKLQLFGNNPGPGKILTSDAAGIATWENPTVLGWSLTGNAGTIDGTNFIGTTDNVPLTLKVNNKKAGRLDANNAFYGAEAGMLNTTGGYGVAIGHQALYNNTTGDGNIAIGYQALVANTTGSHNTAIGYNANVSTKDSKGNPIIVENATAIGENATVNASSKIRLGSTTITEVETQFAYTTVSDGRFKTDINEQEVKGLAFIKKLRPVVYNFDTKKFQQFLVHNMPADAQKTYMDRDFSASTAIRQSGFIAQEVEKAAQQVGYNFNGVHKPENANDNYSLAYSQFVVPLVKGMQEQQTQIEQQEQKIEQLQKVNEQLQQRLQTIEKMIAGNNNNTSAAAKMLPEQTAEDITLFPNPTTGMLTIKANYIDNGIIEMVDMQGNSVQKSTFSNAKLGYQLNISGYAKGIYNLNIIANNKKYTKRLVIQ